MNNPSLREAARREREERVLLRAAYLLSQHPSYFHNTEEGHSLRLTRLELLQVLAPEETR
jgi:hypothetical protein